MGRRLAQLSLAAAAEAVAAAPCSSSRGGVSAQELVPGLRHGLDLYRKHQKHHGVALRGIS